MTTLVDKLTNIVDELDTITANGYKNDTLNYKLTNALSTARSALRSAEDEAELEKVREWYDYKRGILAFGKHWEALDAAEIQTEQLIYKAAKKHFGSDPEPVKLLASREELDILGDEGKLHVWVDNHGKKWEYRDDSWGFHSPFRNTYVTFPHPDSFPWTRKDA